MIRFCLNRNLISVAEGKKIWKVLRQQFKVHFDKLPTRRSGDSAPEEDVDWPYFKSLLFLKDIFEKRPASGSLDNASQELDDETVEDEEDETQLSFYNSISPPTTPLSENSVLTVGSVLKEKQPTPSTSATGNLSKDLGYKKRPADKIGEGLLEIEKQKLKMKQEKQVSHSLVNDEDVAFFTSLLPHVRKLSPVKKLQFRLNVQELLMKTAYGVTSREADNSSNNVAHSVTVPPPAQVTYDGDTSYIMLSNIHSVPTYINDNVTH